MTNYPLGAQYDSDAPYNRPDQEEEVQNICDFCGHNNPEDNFNCEADDCGAPLDLSIDLNEMNLPIITNKK